MPSSSFEPRSPDGPATVPFRTRDACIACGSRDLERILDLPRLPLTGVFVDPANNCSHPPQDQAFLRCASCGHGQLERSLDPDYLYRETYTHRSSVSRISVDGNRSFLEFVCGLEPQRRYRHCVEVGCNDLILLRHLQDRAAECTGFDPIWKTEPPPSEQGVRVVGKYLEEIRPEQDLHSPPDLIVSSHTFEHIHDPLPHLAPLVEYAADDALVVIEVPSLDTLVHTARFDQIFHQHFNYFTLESLIRMAARIDLGYVGHRYNYGYWLGTMGVAFRKQSRVSGHLAPTNSPPRALLEQHYALFESQMRCLDGTLDTLSNRCVPIFGYGAAQMVPILAYHMKFSLNSLQGIVDDDELKLGKTYPGLSVRIVPTRSTDVSDAAVLITALDSTRPILQRLLKLKPRYTVSAIHLF